MQSLTNGGLSRNRTNDTRIFSPLLYQLSYETTWLREKDLNQRPPGYEPDELPDCSIPRCKRWRRSWDSNPGAACTTYRFSRPDPSATWVLLHIKLWWTLQDSNLRPIGYEPTALTNCAKGPNKVGGWSETRTHDLPGMNRML